MMRAMLVSLLGLISAPAFCAQDDARNAFELFGKVCTAQSADWIRAGEAKAATDGWKLNSTASGRHYGVIVSEELKKSEAPLFDSRAWDVAEPFTNSAHVAITVTGPEWPMLKSNSCIFSFDGVDRDRLLTEAAQALGLRIEDAHDGFAPGVRGWAIKNTMNGGVGQLQFIGASQQEVRSEKSSMLFRLGWDITLNSAGLPHQGFMP